jgi:ribosomal subunit interface protein
MKLPVQIAFRGLEPSAAVEAAAREKVAKLELFCKDLISCRVEIEQLDKHRQQGRPFLVRIDVTLPGHELTVNQQPNEDAYVALRDAFDAMRRQVEDVVRRTRDQQTARPSEPRPEPESSA